MSELQKFYDEHKDCKLEIAYPWGPAAACGVNCQDHNVFMKVNPPDMCRAITGKELIKCALAGYCKREIACNN